MQLRVQTVTLDELKATGLIDAYATEIVDRHSETIPSSAASTLDPAEFGDRRGELLVVMIDGFAVGAGGVRLLDPTRAEVKRMYIDPTARGAGAGKRLLSELENAARRLGATEICLDTSARLTEATDLYERAQYLPTETYNDNEHATQWYRKPLIPYNDNIIGLLQSMPIFDHMGINITDVGHGELELRLPITDAVCHSPGAVQAGPMISLGDFAAGGACFTHLGPDAYNSTVNVSAQLLAPATGDTLIARGRNTRTGRALSFGTAEVFTRHESTDSHVATVNVTMRNVAPTTS